MAIQEQRKKDYTQEKKQLFTHIMSEYTPKQNKRLSFVITEDEFNDLEKICKTFNITKTQFLRLMIKNTVENID